MIFVFVCANIIAVSDTTPCFGNADNDDEDDDSMNFPATATPSKKKGHFSDEEGQTDLLENANETNMKLPPIACLCEEPSTEVKKVWSSRDASRWDV